MAGIYGRSVPSLRAVGILLIAAAACHALGCTTTDYGLLSLTIVDHDTADVVAARITLRHDSGEFVVPSQALPVFGDCGKVPFHNWVPAVVPVQAEFWKERSVQNPFRGSTDFYSVGTLTAKLRPGRYRISVEKGPEYRRAEQEFVISAGTEHPLRIVLSRWIDMPARHWYSSDDHLHIPRPHPRFDPRLATWMQAEDIHVANLLQMGLSRDVHVTPQWAFGPRSIYQAGRTLLVGGQENPRTHVLGHSIILGAHGWIDFPQTYLVYEQAWREAHRQGGIAGYAHWAAAGAQDGLALWAHEELIDFIEVLNFSLPYYKTWYEALDLGFRVVPTAGTDYPCGPNLPGRERFYAKLDGPLALDNWLAAVRRGRTFVTNGPVLDFSVEGVGIGDELVLGSPRVVTVKARVRFDPARDRVERVEIVRAGEVVAAREVSGEGGDFAVEASLLLPVSAWLAARASGRKVGELPADPIDPLLAYVAWLKREADRDMLEEFQQRAKHERTRASAAHTAPVYVRVQGTPPIAEQPRAREVARTWLKLLTDLEVRLGEDRIAGLAGFPGWGDGVSLDDLRASRQELLKAIQEARAHYARPLEPD